MKEKVLEILNKFRSGEVTIDEARDLLANLLVIKREEYKSNINKILNLTQEISTWTYLAGTLTQEHQQSVRIEIMAKVHNMQLQLKELQSTFINENQ